jgi:hypothetical protein
LVIGYAASFGGFSVGTFNCPQLRPALSLSVLTHMHIVHTLMTVRFQFDPTKAARNLKKHKVSFADAEGVFTIHWRSMC